MRKLRLFEREDTPSRLHHIHIGIYAVIAVIAVVLDQVTKAIVVGALPLHGTFPLWKDVFHFTYVVNTGAAFSMFSEPHLRWLFIVPSILAIIAIMLYLWIDRSLPLLGGISLALIFGGAVGNMIDRIALGYVVDFLDFRLINFAVFNVADSFVCIGAGMLVLTMILNLVRASKRAKGEDPDSDTNNTNGEKDA